LPTSRLPSSCWRTFDMRRLRPSLLRRCSVAQLAQNCAWFLREFNTNSYDSRMPKRQSKRSLPSLLKMHGPGSNTARFCGIPSSRPTAPSSAPQMCRETISLCWQRSLDISIRSQLRESREVLRTTAPSSSEHVGQFCDLRTIRNLLEEDCPRTGGRPNHRNGPRPQSTRG